MKLTLADTKFIKDSIAILSELVTEARFKISKESIELVAMDPANVAMVIFKLLSSAFVDYEVKEEMTIAINLNDFKQVLRRVKAEDNLTMEVISNKFKITLKGRQTRTFNLPLIELEEKEQKIPELNFKAKVTTDASIITDAIEDMDIIGESVVFTVDKKAINVSSASELTDANVEIKKSDTTKIDTPEKIKAKYSLEYLKKMILGSKLAKDVTINFSKDYPLKLDYLVVDKLQLSFILAPRVDTD